MTSTVDMGSLLRSALLLVGFICAVLPMDRIGAQAMPAGNPVLLAPAPPGFQTPPEFPNQPHQPAEDVAPATMPAEVAINESNLQPSVNTLLAAAPIETNPPINEPILIDDGLSTDEPWSTITETNTDEPTTSDTSSQENSHAINLPQPRATLVDALTPVEDILATSAMKQRLSKLQPGENEADILESLARWQNTIQSMSEIETKTGLHKDLVSSLSQEPQPAAAVQAQEQQQMDPTEQQQQVQTQNQQTLEDIMRDKRQMAARTCPWCGRIIVLG